MLTGLLWKQNLNCKFKSKTLEERLKKLDFFFLKFSVGDERRFIMQQCSREGDGEPFGIPGSNFIGRNEHSFCSITQSCLTFATVAWQASLSLRF